MNENKKQGKIVSNDFVQEGYPYTYKHTNIQIYISHGVATFRQRQKSAQN